jgi:hypothetical protein
MSGSMLQGDEKSKNMVKCKNTESKYMTGHEMRHKRYQIQNRKNRFRTGLTLIELVIAMAMNIIVVLAVGTLLVGGNRAWLRTFDSANRKIKRDALAATVAFGNIGRKANRLSYTIYKVTSDGLVPAKPVTSEPQEVVSGNAVEFKYWDVSLDKTDSEELMDVTKLATAYALFYIDGEKLKVDYGPYPPGAAPAGGGSRNTTGVTTKVLAENVSIEKSNTGAFSHTTLNGMGQGCVRINITLTDPENDESINVMTAVLMRNIWPR